MIEHAWYHEIDVFLVLGLTLGIFCNGRTVWPFLRGLCLVTGGGRGYSCVCCTAKILIGRTVSTGVSLSPRVVVCCDEVWLTGHAGACGTNRVYEGLGSSGSK